MAVKSTISEEDFPKILSSYNLGDYQGFKTFANGAGQTTVLLETNKDRFVLRYYENRPEKHVRFEIELFNFLRSKNYPVPKILENKDGQFVSTYKDKPYIIIEFIEGAPGTNPNEEFNSAEAAEVIKAVAELHKLTEGYEPDYFKDREPFDVEYCWREFKKNHPQLVEAEQGRWLKSELDKLEFPADLPKGLCHADLNYGNFLFRDGKIVAVLDFDMSFYTYLIYDIGSLFFWWASPPFGKFREREAAEIVKNYSNSRPLSTEEKSHIYDALKLICLLGISWSEEKDFERGREEIDRLEAVGREKFTEKLLLEA